MAKSRALIKSTAPLSDHVRQDEDEANMHFPKLFLTALQNQAPYVDETLNLRWDYNQILQPALTKADNRAAPPAEVAGDIRILDNTLGVLDIDAITFQSGNTIRYTFLGTPDLSAVVVNDFLRSRNSTNSSNDGDFVITAVNDGSDFVDVTNTGRSDGTDDETTSPADGWISDETWDGANAHDWVRFNSDGFWYEIKSIDIVQSNTLFNILCVIAGTVNLFDGTQWSTGGVGTDLDWTISGQSVFNTGTLNVGIGTGAAPTNKRLEVKGVDDTTANSSLFATDNSGNIQLQLRNDRTAITKALWRWETTGLGSGDDIYLIRDEGANSATPAGMLHLESDGNVGTFGPNILANNKNAGSSANVFWTLQGQNDTFRGEIGSGPTFGRDLSFRMHKDKGFTFLDSANNELLTVTVPETLFSNLLSLTGEILVLTANTDDLVLLSLSHTNLSGDVAAYNVTGIDPGAGATNIQRWIVNDGAFNLTFTNQDVLSLAPNRFLFSTGANIVVPPNGTLHIIYDVANIVWRDF